MFFFVLLIFVDIDTDDRHSTNTFSTLILTLILFYFIRRLTLVFTISQIIKSSQATSFYPYEDPSLRSHDKIALPSMTNYELDNAFHKAKDAIVARRRLEHDLVRQGMYTDMSKRTAVTRHQAVTTTFNPTNDLEKNQEVFEEMSKLLAQK